MASVKQKGKYPRLLQAGLFSDHPFEAQSLDTRSRGLDHRLCIDRRVTAITVVTRDLHRGKEIVKNARAEMSLR